MIRASFCLLFLSLMTGIAAPLSPPRSAASSNAQLYQILSSDLILDSDGAELGREVRCECYSADDRITVLRTVGDVPISPELDQDSDFDGALWLFDIGSRGAPQVVIRFHRVDGLLTADLHDDQNGDGRVLIEANGRQTAVIESEYWTMRIVALDGYWQRAGSIASNFDLTVDTKMYATFGGRLFIDAMANDGQPDVEVRVRGPQGDDPRSYDWRNVYTPFPASSGIYRTTLMVREEGFEPAYPPLFPWHLLGATDGPTSEDGPAVPNVVREGFDDGIVKLPGRSHPPIQIDWGLGRVFYLGEFVASRGSDYNWFTYSIKRIEPGVRTNPNFESPFAYYDLALDRDFYPELAIRVGRFGDDHPAPDDTANGSQGAQAVRYSWDQTNETIWSFKLGLLGRQTVDGLVSFPDFELQTIPYADVPKWVTEQPWAVATFVAAERPIFTSEGIYDWDFTRDTSDYYGGTVDTPGSIGSAFGGLGGGLRGDYSLNYQKVPRLTFNPIDRKLHLESAEGGIWNLLDGRQLRFLNMTSGRTFDGWQVWDGDRLVSQLFRVPGGLLYSDEEQTLYLRVEIPDELFNTLPPTNHAEWVNLGNQLEEHTRDLEPGNLLAMFQQFEGTATRIVDGPISDFRQDGSGISFAVEATDNRSFELLEALTGVRPQQGVQVLALIEEQWILAPGTFATPRFTVDTGNPDVLREAMVTIAVANDGSMPIADAELFVFAIAADGRRFSLLAAEPIEVSGYGRQSIDVFWSPRTVGDWTLEVTLYRAGSNEWTSDRVVLAEHTQLFTVRPGTQVTVTSALTLGWPGAMLERAAVVVILVTLSAVIAWAGLRWQDAER